MKKEETRCYLCGSEVVRNPDKVTLQQRFSTLVKIALIVSAIMTIATLFTDFLPSFTKCMVSTMVLVLVHKSAAQMQANE